MNHLQQTSHIKSNHTHSVIIKSRAKNCGASQQRGKDTHVHCSNTLRMNVNMAHFFFVVCIQVEM